MNIEQPKIERIFNLIKLMSGKKIFTVGELAEKMDTSYRSIYRYIDTFRSAGFVVEKIQGSTYRIIKMPQSFKSFDKLVYFTEEEAAVINSLIENLEETNSFKTTLRKKLSAIYDRTDILNATPKHPTAIKLFALNDAMHKKKRVVLKSYESAHSGTVLDRTVEPYRYTEGCMAIWAYDVENKDCRIFKVSRIGKVQITDIDWQNESEHRDGFVDAFRMAGTERYHVRLELSLRAKNLLAEEFPLAVKDIRMENDKWIYEGDVTHMAGIGRFVIGLIRDIRILESDELRSYISEYLSLCK